MADRIRQQPLFSGEPFLGPLRMRRCEVPLHRRCQPRHDLLARQRDRGRETQDWKAAGQITGIGFAYPAPRGSHALVGTRVPDVALRGGRLYEALSGGRFVLVAPAAVVRAYGLDDLKGREDRLTVESWASDRRTTLLVRPDGYAAWAAESPDAPAVASALAAALGD